MGGNLPAPVVTLGAVTATSIAISWAPVLHAEDYILSCELWNVAVNTKYTTAANSIVFQNLVPGGKYYVWIAARILNSSGSPSHFDATTAATSASPAGWTSTTFQALDSGIGANGAAWFIAPNQTIFQVTAGGPVQIPGAAVRIAVDPSGLPWVVNSAHQIYKWLGSSWQQIPGAALDIGIGANGKVWTIDSTNGAPKSWNGTAWTAISGAGAQISVDPSGNPWVTNAGHQVWRYMNNAWQQIPGSAQDIGIGADGTAYVVGMTSMEGGFGVFHWNATTSSWIEDTGVAGSTVSAGPAGTAYVARSVASGLPVIRR